MTASAKRAIMLTLIVLLVLSTLISIIVVLGSLQGEAAAKLTGISSLGVFFTLTYLLSGMSFERRVMPSIGAVGIGASVLGFLYGLLLVLELIKVESFGPVKPALVLGIIATAAAWISAVISVRGIDDRARAVAWVTAGAVGLFALIVVVLIFGEELPGEGIAKLLSVLASIATLGTFLVPMLAKVAALGQVPETEAPAAPEPA